MKALKVTLIVTMSIFLAVQLMSFKSTSSVEEYEYDVLKKVGDIEIRNYNQALFTKVKLSSNKYEKISSDGFRILAGYIFGGNNKSEEISMTSPVVVEMESSKSMMFMVPKDYDLSSLPEPNNKEITFIEMPSRKIAAIQFGGWANQKKINLYIDKLKEQLKTNNIEHKGNFSFFGYNPPYEVFNRRNEVVVELKN